MPTRFGAGELYGEDLSALTPARIRELSRVSRSRIRCPFRSAEQGKPFCNKKGGVCSLRQFTLAEDGKVTTTGELATTCPTRFDESGLVIRWIGETLLNTSNPLVISELPFLMTEVGGKPEDEDAVGKIDKVLVHVDGKLLSWCAVEKQAVYFSGMSMENDFKVMREWNGPGLPFPPVQRRPDFRSSGPKRLMPQLQIKVPTISRWGKKMAVVIDKAFWDSLGEMRETKDLSNSEIVWFVVDYQQASRGRFEIQRHEMHFTTLDHAVEGLTGGTPMPLHRFEAEIRARLSRA